MLAVASGLQVLSPQTSLAANFRQAGLRSMSLRQKGPIRPVTNAATLPPAPRALCTSLSPSARRRDNSSEGPRVRSCAHTVCRAWRTVNQRATELGREAHDLAHTRALCFSSTQARSPCKTHVFLFFFFYRRHCCPTAPPRSERLRFLLRQRIKPSRVSRCFTE